MTVRRRKKVRRLRGSKTHGFGSKKKHRGGGSRGGRGQAGMKKHKKSWMLKYEPKHFGKFGFKISRALAGVKKERKVINLKELDKIAKKIGKREINLKELGYSKLLGTGKITQPLTVHVSEFSKKAKEKIEKIGGKIV